MTASEKTSEGVALTGQKPDSATKPKLKDTDPQAYEVMLAELRRAFGLPEADFKSFDAIVAWVLDKCEQANGKKAQTNAEVWLKDLMNVIFLPEEAVPVDWSKRVKLAADRVAGMRDKIGRLSENNEVRLDLVKPAPATGPAEFLNALLAKSDLSGPAAFEILGVCMELAIFLIDKNRNYGDSALDPVRIMSSADPVEQIKVRMDDKLSRLYRGNAGGEDAMKDLVGYWVLLMVASRRKAASEQSSS